MLPIRSIVCPVDFSDCARLALEYALAFASRQRARLTIVHAIEPLLAEAASAAFHDHYLRDTKAELKAFVGLAGLGPATWAPRPALVVSVGEPWTEVLRAAEVHGADFLVMGTHGLGGLRPRVFGSTTERVMRAATMPVLAVPAGGRRAIRLTPERPILTFATILAAVDLKEGSDDVVRSAAELSADLHARLLVAHVVQPIEATARWHDSLVAAEQLRRTAVRGDLEALVAALPPDLGVDTAIAEGGPGETLVELATGRHAGAIVIGSGQPRSGTRHRLGPTTHRVLALTDVPVMTVPPAPAGAAASVRTRRAIELSAFA